MKRREFVKICASAVAGVSASPELLAKSDRKTRFYNRVGLIDHTTKEPVRASSLAVGKAHIFHYPFISTPCFLINLGDSLNFNEELLTEAGESYRWNGGVGKNRSIVAFSAICAHKMSHPTPSVSFINYRHDKVKFLDHDQQVVEGKGMIYCCSEKSVFDPSKGAKVAGGPASQPLAAIVLEYDKNTDNLQAVATVGGEMFQNYFNAFEQRLILQFGRTDIREPSANISEVMPIEKYCRNQINCSA